MSINPRCDWPMQTDERKFEDLSPLVLASVCSKMLGQVKIKHGLRHNGSDMLKAGVVRLRLLRYGACLEQADIQAERLEQSKRNVYSDFMGNIRGAFSRASDQNGEAVENPSDTARAQDVAFLREAFAGLYKRIEDAERQDGDLTIKSWTVKSERALEKLLYDIGHELDDLDEAFKFLTAGLDSSLLADAEHICKSVPAYAAIKAASKEMDLKLHDFIVDAAKSDRRNSSAGRIYENNVAYASEGSRQQYGDIGSDAITSPATYRGNFTNGSGNSFIHFGDRNIPERNTDR